MNPSFWMIAGFLAILTILIVYIAVEPGPLPWISVQNALPTPTAKPTVSGMCRGRAPGDTDLKAVSIFSCIDKNRNQIYEVNYNAKDAGSGYFDSKENFIAQCGMMAQDPYPGKCKELILETPTKYACNQNINLLPNFCPELNSYLACACGCCPEVEPLERCLYRSKDDDIEKIIEEDRRAGENPNCAFMGCSRGIKYRYCD